MLSNYIVVAFRNLLRRRFFSLINLAGLATGMAACLLIAQFLRFEWSYDRQSPHAEHIWRAFNQTIVDGAVVTEDANTHSALGPALKNDLPDDVADYARIYNRNESSFVFIGDKGPTRIEGAWIADPGFLRMFPQKKIAGDLKTCLDEPNSLVLSRSAAESLFGEAESALGRTVRIPAEPFYGLFTVKAVVENPPANTHIKFNALAGYATRYAQGHRDNWDTYWEYNYFQLKPQADVERVRRKMADYSAQFLQSEGIRYGMQRLVDIRLHSNLTYEIEPNGSARSIQFLGVVAALILLIAFINYINLSTARALHRAREVGVRKVVGAGRAHLIAQFMVEGGLLNAAALVAALGITHISMPAFSDLTGRPLMNVPGYDPTFWMMAGALWGAGLLIACLQPALMLSGFSPLRTLKGVIFTPKRSAHSARQTLVVFQFACSIILLVGVFAIYAQLSFLRKHDKGLSLDQIAAFKLPKNDWRLDSVIQPKMSAMRQEIARLSGVRSVAVSGITPGAGISSISGTSARLLWARNRQASAQATTYFIDAEKAFFDTYGIRLLAGEIYNPLDEAARHTRVVVNEAAAKAIGFPSAEAAVGEEIAFENSADHKMQIMGVVADFHIESLKTHPKPTLYYCNAALRSGYISVKIEPGHTTEVVRQVSDMWRQYWPESPVEYHFADEQFDRQYRSERQLGQVFGLFAALAVLIACLGLLGLVTFTAEQRVKEIGVRKVLGASVASVTALLSKDLLKLVFIAILIAAPIAYYLAERWLRDFAYRISLQWEMFAAAGTVAVLIALLTVGFQSVRAALANPVNSLRNE